MTAETNGPWREPDGYHYEYAEYLGSVIRKNSGERVNGSDPIRAIPYWYAAPPAAPPEPVIVANDNKITEPAADADALVRRLRGYNPPDRTIDSQRAIAQDISDAANLIEQQARELAELRGANGQLFEHGKSMYAELDALRASVARLDEPVRSLNAAINAANKWP